MHLFALFGGFFLAFFLFLGFFARYYYQAAVVENLKTEFDRILEDRLFYSSQSVSAAFYSADKAFIDTVNRLQQLYIVASQEPYPLRADYVDVVDKADLAGG